MQALSESWWSSVMLRDKKMIMMVMMTEKPVTWSACLHICNSRHIRCQWLPLMWQSLTLPGNECIPNYYCFNNQTLLFKKNKRKKICNSVSFIKKIRNSRFICITMMDNFICMKPLASKISSVSNKCNCWRQLNSHTQALSHLSPSHALIPEPYCKMGTAKPKSQT